MDTGIKNGKHHTNNISILKLLFLISVTYIVALSSFASPAGEKDWVIVIDAGHGGKDPGALGSFARESNIALAIALKTGRYIEQNVKNAKVLYTRKTDVFVELTDRAEFANKNKADLFISIHANWGASKTVRGTETYIMGLAKDDQNLEVAMKENEVILLEDDFSTKYEGFDPKSPESYIMFTLMQNIFREQSTGIASNIQSQFRDRVSRVDRGVKQAGFWVLYMTTMPSVLVETGFITNQEEEQFLTSDEGQDYLASAIFRATRDYINEIDKKSYRAGITDQPENIVQAANSGQPSEKFIDTLAVQKADTAEEIFFMVQFKISMKQLALRPENFKGIEDVREFRIDNLYKYASGKFLNLKDATEYRKKILLLYQDAFVIAVQGNKILPLQKAIELKRKK